MSSRSRSRVVLVAALALAAGGALAARARYPAVRLPGGLRCRSGSAPTRTICRSRTTQAKGSRTASPSCSPMISMCRLRIHAGGRSAAASSATRCAPASATSSSACRTGYELTAQHPALLPLDLRHSCRAPAASPYRSLDDPRLARADDRRAADRRRFREHAAGTRADPARHHRQRASAIRSMATTARTNPPADIVDAVADGEIDVALVWGPLAGYFAPRQNQPLAIDAAAGRGRRSRAAVRLRHRDGRTQGRSRAA